MQGDQKQGIQNQQCLPSWHFSSVFLRISLIYIRQDSSFEIPTNPQFAVPAALVWHSLGNNIMSEQIQS
jgi:hypothetical protein